MMIMLIIKLKYRIQVMDSAPLTDQCPASFWAKTEIPNYYFPLKVLDLTCRVKRSISLSKLLGMCFVPYLMYFLFQLAIDAKIPLCFLLVGWFASKLRWLEWKCFLGPRGFPLAVVPQLQLFLSASNTQAQFWCLGLPPKFGSIVIFTSLRSVSLLMYS